MDPDPGIPGEGTPSMLGDMDVPLFWPPFLTFWGLNSIFLGYFFSSTNTKTIFRGIKTTNSHIIRSFWPQILFFPRSFWVQFSAASDTPPSVFGPSTPQAGIQTLILYNCIVLILNLTPLAAFYVLLSTARPRCAQQKRKKSRKRCQI